MSWGGRGAATEGHGPRALGLRALPGAEAVDPGQVLGQVRRAIELERRSAYRPWELQVTRARCIDEEQGLWALRVQRDRSLGRLQEWQGAFVWAGLAQRVEPWTAEVLDASEQGRHLVVEVGQGERPVLGAALARPVDFLMAPHRLLNQPNCAALHTDYAALLGAALGVLVGRPIPGGWSGGERWSWAALWGPPGTGKTHTLGLRVLELLADPSERVLVLSTTNQATDQVALRVAELLRQQALERGEPERMEDRALRVGMPRVASFQAAGCLHVLPKPAHRMVAIEQALEQLEGAKTPYRRALARRKVGRLKRGLPVLRELLIEGPQCVISTLSAALSALVSEDARPLLDNGHAPFTTVILDEAGLVPRATAAAAGLLASRQVLLVGDPKQLAPICVASRSLEPQVKRWLAVSALETVDEHQPWVQALHTQYRMHPQVRAAVSELQYQGRLKDAPAVLERPWHKGGRLVDVARAQWLVLDALAERGLVGELELSAERAEGRSWMRRASLEAARRMLLHYPELRQSQGLFLTPYLGQAHAAQAMLTEVGAQGWTASTVHAQQGAQAQVVLFDLVRPGGWPALEWKRLINVGLSRAQHYVCVLASRREMEQPWLRSLTDSLVAFELNAAGGLVPVVDSEQPDLFGGGLSKLVVAEPSPKRWAAPLGDPASLYTQIQWQRASRRTLTRAQTQLISRELRDLGPRVVRGVAGSGKTVVLARWAAAELCAYPDKQAVVLFGNLSLEPHLRHLLRGSWPRVSQAPYPQERVELHHVGTLMAGLMEEQGLPKPTEQQRFELEWQAQRVLESGTLEPRFDLLYIDEAQDLGHATLALLISLVRPSDGQVPVRIFYDNAQNVYGRSTPRWLDFGLDLRGRSTHLKESFRATRQGMELALNVLDGLQPLGQDPDVKELISPRSGPPLLVQEPDGWWRADYCVVRGQLPQVLILDSREQEQRAVGERIAGWLADGVRPVDIRVLCGAKWLGEQLAQLLPALNIPCALRVSRQLLPTEDTVLITTPHSFKGYEAEIVVVFGVDQFWAKESGPLCAALYVAMTRAKTLMLVSAVRGPDPGGLVAALERAAGLQRGR